MKASHYCIIALAVCFTSCRDNSTSPTVHDNYNSPVTTNVTNSFTYAVNANQYSENSRNTLSFVSDSLVVTLTASNYMSGQAIVSVKDSSGAPIFADTVASNTTLAIAHLKAESPRYCDIVISGMTAKLVFVLAGE
ncbi:MAG: hypothetical protein KGJ59_13125 [Bacteroidota bacterium]|nr:hypothetical protein [Bacteroidota bacterium]